MIPRRRPSSLKSVATSRGRGRAQSLPKQMGAGVSHLQQGKGQGSTAACLIGEGKGQDQQSLPKRIGK